MSEYNRMRKHIYYFRKTKSEVVKEIFAWLLIGGMVCIAATSPFFIVSIIKGYGRFKKYKKEKVYDAFYNLRRQGYIGIRRENNQIYIELTEKGKLKSRWLKIDNLTIKKPKKWDGKWRIVIFDIAQLKRIYREAFRGKLKEIGFQPLQKSVWTHPFDCKEEIKLLKDFFGLSDAEMRFIIANDIGDAKKFRQIFKI